MNDEGRAAIMAYYRGEANILPADDTPRTSPACPAPDAVAVPTNEPHEVSARRGWVVLDGERLWTDGVIVDEDGRKVMRFYYGEIK